MNLENFKENYWKDPVWSKVIAFLIISIGTFITTTLYIYIKSLYDKVTFKEISKKVFQYFKSTIEVNTFLFWFSLIVLSIFLVSFIFAFIKKLKRLETNSKNHLEIEIELPRTGMPSTAIIAGKLAGAFPGQRGFEWYESKEAIKRLEKFFEPPLVYQPIGEGVISNPIWWFRDFSSMYIDKFKKLSKTKLLIGIREFKIKRIGVFVSQSDYKSFIYVETLGERQTGLYNFKKEDIKRHVDTIGYSSEEYAIFNKKINISREHYDDAATIIKGKIVDTFGSELRVRFLSDYNFLIAANQSSFNSRKFEKDSSEDMNKILKGEMRAEEFIEKLKLYKRKEEYL